jgi:hypothetical protein
VKLSAVFFYAVQAMAAVSRPHSVATTIRRAAASATARRPTKATTKVK